MAWPLFDYLGLYLLSPPALRSLPVHLPVELAHPSQPHVLEESRRTSARYQFAELAMAWPLFDILGLYLLSPPALSSMSLGLYLLPPPARCPGKLGLYLLPPPALYSSRF